MPRTTRTAMTRVKSKKNTLANLHNFSLFSSFLSLEKTGINAEVIAPSAVSRLSRFGMMYAIVNASAPVPVPRKKAWIISLKYPRIRLNKVGIETANVDLNNLRLLLSSILNMRASGSCRLYYELTFYYKYSIIHHLFSIGETNGPT